MPSDHNYRLYSALIEQNSNLKTINWQLGTIKGIPDKNGWITIGNKSFFWIRCKLSDIEQFKMLDNKILNIGKSLIQLSESKKEILRHKFNLRSRIVTIKSKWNEQINSFEFGVALGKQLITKGIQTMPVLGDRKSLRIKNTNIIGYSLRFEKLSINESLSLQIEGLGGRRRMGCGVFDG